MSLLMRVYKQSFVLRISPLSKTLCTEIIRFLLMFRHTLRLTLLIETPCENVNQPSHDVIRSQLHLHRSTHLPGDRIDSSGDASTRMLSARARG